MSAPEVTQEVLDATQYSTASILNYEAVYGEDYVSPGGEMVATELIRKLGLEPNSRVLDVGCGLGGSAFVMARDFGLQVDGIDLSENMLRLANEKCHRYGLQEQVTLTQGDCLKLDRADFYDAIYSRDVFLHISDKSRLFEVLRLSLGRGGKLLFTDYCCGPKPWSIEFTTHVENRGYSLHTLTEYADLITQTGFVDVECFDLTNRFIDILHCDIEKFHQLIIDETSRASLESAWRAKLARVESGDHRWGLFTAVK